MPRYVKYFLQKYLPPTPHKPKHQPHEHNPPNYGKRIQFSNLEDIAPTLNKYELKELMVIIGLLLFLVHAVDNT